MDITNDIRVTVRVDRGLKENAEALFARLGMNMSVAFNVFLRKAVDEQAIPFAVSAKSSEFGTGYSVEDLSRAFSEAAASAVAENQSRGLPVARYDGTKGAAYLEYGDGRREYVDGE
ncbi:MAG: type II toxin-antitoxin system RelB/DinJ family antitoxin [Clostridiales Family XIII bacterium]|jgi:DNA-damage-inducible protein J|nr:type II toxin-antitoxin system RelB/DinJ family antitoxin [Clostridiales Family XIII bacterium]